MNEHTVQIIRGWSNIVQEVCISLCEGWRRGVGEVKYSMIIHSNSCSVLRSSSLPVHMPACCS